MIDTDKYEGHTEGPWYITTWLKGDPNEGGVIPASNMYLFNDAPLLLQEVKRMRGVIYDALYVLQTDGWNKNRADAINRLEKILIKGWEGEEE